MEPDIKKVYSLVLKQNRAALLDYIGEFRKESEIEALRDNEINELKFALKQVIGGDSLI